MTADDASASEYRHVACCVDRSDASLAALEEAARLAAATGARLSVVHVVETPGGFTGGRSPWSPREDVVAEDLVEDARAWMSPLAERHGDARAVVLQGDDAPGAVLGWAREEGCDLLVSAPRRGGLARALLGSFASRVVRDAACPVVLVPERA